MCLFRRHLISVLHSYPVLRYHVLIRFVHEPSLWGYNYFLWICIEPCTPPGKCAIRNDVMATQAHELQMVACFGTGARLIHKNCRK